MREHKMNTAKSTNKNFYGVKQSMDTTSNISCAFQIHVLAIAIACFSPASFATQGLDYITPPKYQTMDKYNVNVAGNQLSPTIETVSIGGELGLSHSITARGNYFDLSPGGYGYHDKYAGGLKFTGLGTHKSPGGYPDVPGTEAQATVMRASFLGQQADFMVIKNDGTYLWYLYAGTDYHYKAVGDQRHTLERRTDGLVWTQPDGTEVFLSTADVTNTASATQNHAVKKIVYPTGFTIYVGTSFVGVFTNTGFALRYDFDSADPGLDPSKQSRVFPNDNNVPAVSSAFRSANPKCVTAVNTAIEAYDVSTSTPCTLAKKWPKATFTWPGGMPRAMFIDRSTFTVTNAAGVKTDLIYEAQDAGIPTNPRIPSNTPWKLVAPRLVEIKSAGATASTAFYTYQNENPTVQCSMINELSTCNANYNDDRLLSGILMSATGMLGLQNYDTSDLGGHNVIYGKSYTSGGDILVRQYNTSPVGIIEHINNLKGDITYFELGYRNFVTRQTFGWAPQKVYEYDDRGNLYKVTQAPGFALASYPATCTNRKTCNQPEWVKDPNGNQTDYTYHQLSGQVETVTLPANKNGKRAQTRYEYTPLQATYFSGSGTTTGTPIYLKTAEKYCINSNFIGEGDGNSIFSGACELGANDEVVTRYEYDSTKNLRLKGATVTAVNTANEQTVKRTCYQYDIYNNLIGETQPNANPASCN